MFSVIDILGDNKYKNHKVKWLSYFNNKKYDQQFVSMLWPVFNYMEQELAACVAVYFPEEFKQNFFVNDLVMRFANMLSRNFCQQIHDLLDSVLLKVDSPE